MSHPSLMTSGFYSDISDSNPAARIQEFNLGQTPLHPHRDGQASSVRPPGNMDECRGGEQALEMDLSDKK